MATSEGSLELITNGPMSPYPLNAFVQYDTPVPQTLAGRAIDFVSSTEVKIKFLKSQLEEFQCLEYSVARARACHFKKL